MNGSKIIHVHFKVTGVDEYFGSLAAVFQVHDEDNIGVKKQSLYNYRITPEKPYENKNVVIKEGVVVRKITSRSNPNVK